MPMLSFVLIAPCWFLKLITLIVAPKNLMGSSQLLSCPEERVGFFQNEEACIGKLVLNTGALGEWVACGWNFHLLPLIFDHKTFILQGSAC